ncbi:MAG: hypothetical protein AAGE59_25545 [Cyanobacteria bacterium P01_F01_bin.86]
MMLEGAEYSGDLERMEIASWADAVLGAIAIAILGGGLWLLLSGVSSMNR